jgi:transcriptional regulator of NAD metabolism
LWRGPATSLVEAMSDKSPKELHKLAEQKKHKDEVQKHEKEHTNEIVHHPVSGNPTTLAEEEEVVAAIEKAPLATEPPGNG